MADKKKVFLRRNLSRWFLMICELEQKGFMEVLNKYKWLKLLGNFYIETNSI